ncbi:Uu.00g129870.m01.CDS01 [Anthostomella pinea]|uniref:Uu.00g129870.m01.CDS01 n=1 Tax=Anthostomella pinea TaxID=933095 RepID=A0AAI8YFQ0_9PEZI|nr:Uu.00g129870.m01.CDS01 [Anthostomella pinea]
MLDSDLVSKLLNEVIQVVEKGKPLLDEDRPMILGTKNRAERVPLLVSAVREDQRSVSIGTIT